MHRSRTYQAKLRLKIMENEPFIYHRETLLFHRKHERTWKKAETVAKVFCEGEWIELQELTRKYV